MIASWGAGPERSGSTWLFNAVRLLYEEAGLPLDTYWMTHLTDRKLNQRGLGALLRVMKPCINILGF